MSKPIIVQVITSPSGGGAEILVRELARQLSNYNFESKAVYFSDISLSQTGSIQFEPNEFVIGHGSPKSITVIKKLRHILRQLLASNSKVLVHTHLTWPFFYTPIAVFDFNLPLLHTEHNSFNKRRRNKILKPIDSYFYSRYKKVFCISQGVKNELYKWIDSSAVSVNVIENGTRLFDWVERKIPCSNLLKLISVGSLNRKKGFDIAIKAVAEVRNYIAEYKIIGEGPERQNLELLISQLNLQNIVKLPGWSNNVEAEYAAANLQLIPSRWEGFGLVTVEGMSTGLPVLVANVSGLNEVVKPNELFNPLVDGDYLTWASAIKEFAQNIGSKSDYYKNISRDLHNQSQKFSLDNMVKNYAIAYDELLQYYY